jgi:hypothetical protein
MRDVGSKLIYTDGTVRVFFYVSDAIVIDNSKLVLKHKSQW